jgi:hypothetical protein
VKLGFGINKLRENVTTLILHRKIKILVFFKEKLNKLISINLLEVKFSFFLILKLELLIWNILFENYLILNLK